MPSGIRVKVDNVKYAMEKSASRLQRDIMAVDMKVENHGEIIRNMDEKYTQQMELILNDSPRAITDGTQNPEINGVTELKEEIEGLKGEISGLKEGVTEIVSTINSLRYLLTGSHINVATELSTLTSNTRENETSTSNSPQAPLPPDLYTPNGEIDRLAYRRKYVSPPLSRLHPEWQLSPDTDNTLDLLKEWYGPRDNDVPSVEYLDAAYGTKWRANMSFHKLRKAVINFIRDQQTKNVVLKGLSREQLASLLDEYKEYKDYSFKHLCKLLQLTPGMKKVAADLSAMWLDNDED